MMPKNSQIEREDDGEWSDPGMGSSSSSNSSWIKKMMGMFSRGMSSNREQSEKSGSFMETMSRHMESLMGMFSNMMGSLGQRGSMNRWNKNSEDVEVFGTLKTAPSMQLNMPQEYGIGENVSTDSIKEGNFDGLRKSFETYLDQTREALKNSWTRMQEMLMKQRDRLNGTFHRAIEGMKNHPSTDVGKELPGLTNMTDVMQNITKN